MFPTTLAGSLPKPSWLAEPDKLWPQWRLTGADLATGKLDATLVALKLQEDASVDIVTDGEQSRQHFVHGFLEFVDGIDFGKKVEMGIRNNRYKAMVPTVTGALKLRGRVHGAEAQFARAHTTRKLKITMPGPMTIIDTIADAHYGDRVKMAFAFADLLNQEARALEADGVDVINYSIGGGAATSVATPTDIAFLGGIALMMLGGTGEVGGVALDATGVGAVAGVPINIAAAGVIAAGATMTMVPLMVAVLFVAVSSQVPLVGSRFADIAGVIPVYAAFLAIMVAAGVAVAHMFRLAPEPSTAVVFSGATRNSLVVLPLALAVEG